MKKTLAMAGVILVGAATLLFVNKPSEKKEEIAKSEPVMVNEYPNMTFIMPDGSVKNSRELSDKSIIIVYFPDCDHCQREATEINNHLTAFENYDLWFISTAPYKDIDRFAKAYKLTDHPKVHFARTEMQDVISNFGAIPTPSVYIYSNGKRLVKAFNGETKIEEIIKYL